MYGLVIGIAVVCAWEITSWLYSYWGGKRKDVVRAGWGIILGAVVGARAYHVIDYWEFYQDNLGQIWVLWMGGLSIWGALGGGGLALWLLEQNQQRRWRILAALTCALPLAQAIGRVGNYFNGEFMELVGVVPWWMAESLANLALFGVMLFLVRQNLPPRKLVGSYLIGYGLIRLVLEGFREIRWEMGGLPVASIIALTAVIIGLWLIKNVPDSYVTLKGKKT